jgi:hypothetical protein
MLGRDSIDSLINGGGMKRGNVLLSTVARNLLAIVLLVLAGCALEPLGHKDLLDFLSDGVTRREDVQLKLGEPSSRYGSSKILAYRLRSDEWGYVLVRRRDNWECVTYSLILVFAANGVLRRHSLVEVHAS